MEGAESSYAAHEGKWSSKRTQPNNAGHANHSTEGADSAVYDTQNPVSSIELYDDYQRAIKTLGDPERREPPDGPAHLSVGGHLQTHGGDDAGAQTEANQRAGGLAQTNSELKDIESTTYSAQITAGNNPERQGD